MNSSLQKCIWGHLIHLVCNVKGARTEATVLICWWISVSLMREMTPSCRHWLCSFPSYAIREDGGKACCDVASKSVGKFSYKREETQISSQPSSERSQTHNSLFCGQVLTLSKSPCFLPSCPFGFALCRPPMSGVIWAQLCPWGGFGQKVEVLPILNLINGTVLSAF